MPATLYQLPLFAALGASLVAARNEVAKFVLNIKACRLSRPAAEIMSFIPLTVVWWFVLHLGNERNWHGVTASKLPRPAAHWLPQSQVEGSLTPAEDVPIQAVSLSESFENLASPGPADRPNESFWRRWLRGLRLRSGGHKTPSGARDLESYTEAQGTGAASSGLGKTGEGLEEGAPSIASSSSLFSSRSSLSSEGSMAEAGAAGGEHQARWIDVNYPFFQHAMGTIHLRARRRIAKLLERRPDRRPVQSVEDIQFVAAFEECLPEDPFTIEPYSKKDHFSFSVRRGQLLGSGGNAVVYKVVDARTGKALAMKISRLKSERIGLYDPALFRESTVFGQLRSMAKRAAKRIRAIRMAFAQGGSAEQLLAEDFINIPLTLAGRVRGLSKFFLVGDEWIVFNSVGLYEVAAMDLLHFVSLHRQRLTRSMRENLTREMVIGLAKVHAYGMAHRDVKPENMLIHFTGQLSFADLDSALPFKTPEGKPTRLDCAPGSPGASVLYFAPEVAQCGANRQSLLLTPTLDAWPLGMCLYFLWCERSIYPRGNNMRAEELLSFISSLTARESLRLSFEGCHSMSPEIRSFIEGLLDPEAKKRLTPLDIVRISPFFSRRTHYSSIFRLLRPAS